jgi:sugar/nucleoside kinase (ribokinase family)
MAHTAAYDVAAIGNAIVDVIARADEAFLEAQGLAKGTMTLIDADRAVSLYAAMTAGVEASGGSAGNTIAGVASLGGKAAYIGKVANDQLGDVFAHDTQALGARFDTPRLIGGAPTGRSLINVTDDGQRTMATFLGAANQLTPDDVDEALIRDSAIVYLEGYLFDPPPARAAFERAAAIARDAGRKISITLSDVFVVDRWRAELLAFIESSVDIVFANENELNALFQSEDFDAAAAQIRGMVEVAALTRGERGSVLLRGGERQVIPVYPAEVIDTTGAGDQYAAGVLYGLSHELPLDVCGRLGALAASECIGHYGPRPLVSLRNLAAEAGLI